MAEALEAERLAAEDYESAEQAYQAARQAVANTTAEHDAAVRDATRAGKALPKAPDWNKLQQAVRDTRTALNVRASQLTNARARVLTTARDDFPALRTAAVDQLDLRQAAVADALQTLRQALAARSEARTIVGQLDEVYGEDWARSAAGMRRPFTGDGKPIGAEASLLRTVTSQRRAQTDHALRTLAREVEYDKQLRQAIEQSSPDSYRDAKAG
jgi:hypothetical protein